MLTMARHRNEHEPKIMHSEQGVSISEATVGLRALADCRDMHYRGRYERFYTQHQLQVDISQRQIPLTASREGQEA